MIADELGIDDRTPTHKKPEAIEAQDIWTMLGTQVSQRNNRHAEDVADVMSRLGYPKKRRTREGSASGRLRWVWVRADLEEQLKLKIWEPPARPRDEDGRDF